MNSIIEIKELDFLNIISYPNIEIKPQLATFICGESGCGKSTLLRLINGVVSSNNGNVFYLGRNINLYDPIVLRREILLCSQSVYLFDMSILDNFNEYYNYRGLSHLNSDSICEYLKVCCLNFPIDSICTNMSGGERHRVFIAICLSFLPKVLMLDEPTAALDQNTANNLMYNLKSFCRKKNITLIVVCHDKFLSEKYADDVIILNGREGF